MSFKDEVVISFEATKDTFAEDSQVVKINDKTRLLRFAVVYGYNASGKSNLLKAINFLRMFWFNKPQDMNQETGVTPFKLDAHTPNEHTKFEMVFYVGSTKYAYFLELDRQQVYLEKLSYYKTEQPTMLFDRQLIEGKSVILFGSSLKISNIVKENLTVNCLKNMSFFAARNQVNTSITLIDVAKDFLSGHIGTPILSSSEHTSALTLLSKRFISTVDILSSFLLEFLNEADFNISNLKTDITPTNQSKKIINAILDEQPLSDDEIKNLGSTLLSKEIKTSLYHSVENERGKETYCLSLDNDEESLGTVRTLGIATFLFITLSKNHFVAIDEIETSLHPKLLEKILYEFLKVKNSRSQLIVTTHNDGLLDLTDDLIRKDSVWFTEKQKNGSTELYKLTDFRGVNRLSSIREAYRNKRFGATMNN